MSSGSSTSSSTETTTEQKDQRVTASDSAIAIGAGGSLQVTDQFSDNVKDAFNELIAIARDAGLVAKDFAEKALTKVADRASESEKREQASTATLQSLVMLTGITGIIWIFLNSKTDLTKIFRG